LRGAQLTPLAVEDWTQISAVPTAAFKELELTSLAPDDRTTVFIPAARRTKAQPHFHNAESLALYEPSLWAWFEPNLFSNCELRIANCDY